MDYAKPADVVASMIGASLKKLALSPRLGNLVGGVLFTAIAPCATYKPAGQPAAAIAAQVPAE